VLALFIQGVGMLKYGCECKDQCLIHREDEYGPANKAPVAYRISRGDKVLEVCTRCNLSSDTILEIIPTKIDPSKSFFDYDFLGALLLSIKMEEVASSFCN
jgi:hypothetical protein